MTRLDGAINKEGEGCVLFSNVVFSSAAYQVDGDAPHVIRSTEFEVMGEGESLTEALSDFFGHARDLFDLIAESAHSGDATEHELRQGVLLGLRLVSGYELTDTATVRDRLEWRSSDPRDSQPGV